MASSGTGWKSSQEYPINAGVPQGFNLSPTLFLIYIIYLMLSIISLLKLMKLFSTLNVIRHLIWDTADWDRKWLVNSNAGKTQLVSFDRPNKICTIDVKVDGSVLVEKSSFKMMGWPFFSKLDWGCYIIFIAKTDSKKTGALIRSINFLSLRLRCIFINLTYDLAWNIFVMPGLVLLAATWSCMISYK